MSSFSQFEDSKDGNNQQENAESSIYSDACSNSLELAQLNKKKQEKRDVNFKEKNKEELKNMNQNDSTLISLSDINSQNRKGSIMSFNSTKSTLYIKKNCKNLKNIKVNIPNKFYLNNKYASNTNQILSPIDEKGRGSNDLLLPVFSAEYKKQSKNFDQKDFFNLRQSLEPNNNKFIFSPNININQNYFNFKNNINLNLKKKILPKKEESSIIDSDNESINIDIIIKKKTKSNKFINKEDIKQTKIKPTSSFKLRPKDILSKKRHSINSSLEIKKFLKFEKITNISEIEFKGINKDEIDLDFLKQKLRTIPVKSYKKLESDEKCIKNLIEVQNFYAEKCPIWVMKLSKNYEYLALGSKNGTIKIFSFLNYNSDDFDFIYTKKNICNYFKFLSEKPFLILDKHTKDIIDLSWSPFNYDLLLSASVDNFVILWDISKSNGDNIIKKFNHGEIITCLSFSPMEPNIFVTGCFDKFIRFFKIDDSLIIEEDNIEDNTNPKLNESKSTINVNFNSFCGLNKLSTKNKEILNKYEILNYFNINEIITAVEFFPDGSKLAIGTHKGKVLVYKISDNIQYDYCFYCRNKLGQFSSGKKITSIHFIDRIRALITTSDSRIRLVSMDTGKIIHKYKGHQNLNSMIKSSTDLINDVVISGSEDNFCYIWDLFDNKDSKVKNYKYEYFKPFARENIYCSLIAPEICYTNYIKKIYKLTNKLNIISVIINATDNGRLEVLLNVEENHM